MRAEQIIRYSSNNRLEGTGDVAIGSKTFIVAPHCDDEVIGCYSVLKGPNVAVQPIVFGNEDLSYRVDETRHAMGLLNTSGEVLRPVRPMALLESLTKRIASLMEATTYAYFIVWFPDPDFEVHPHHKLIGQIGRHLAHEVAHEESPIVVGFYSINMKAPYILPLSREEQQEKRHVLYVAFESQRGYFDTNHESFIFEGRTMV